MKTILSQQFEELFRHVEEANDADLAAEDRETIRAAFYYGAAIACSLILEGKSTAKEIIIECHAAALLAKTPTHESN